MTDDPPRLMDTEGAEVATARALLRQARRVPAMSADDRAAILSAIGTATGGAAVVGAAASATKAGWSGAAKATIALGLGSVAVGATAVAMLFSHRAPPATAHVAAPPTSIVIPPLPQPPLAVEPAPSAPQGSPEATAAASAKPPRGASTPSARPPSEEDTLGAESALITRARATLESNPGDALALVDEHARRFPRGELAAERDFLRIKALRRIGRTDEARQRARTYTTKYPSSPYAPSVRAILGELGGP